MASTLNYERHVHTDILIVHLFTLSDRSIKGNEIIFTSLRNAI